MSQLVDIVRQTAEQKKQIFQLAVDRLLTQDQASLAAVFVQALEEGAASTAGWRSQLIAWAEQQTAGNQLASDIVTALQDGSVSRSEAIQVGLKWVKRRLPEPALGPLLDKLAAGDFAADDAWKLLLRTLPEIEVPQEMQTRLEQVVADGTISRREVLQILGTWAAVAAPENLIRAVQPALARVLSTLFFRRNWAAGALWERKLKAGASLSKNVMISA